MSDPLAPISGSRGDQRLMVGPAWHALATLRMLGAGNEAYNRGCNDAAAAAMLEAATLMETATGEKAWAIRRRAANALMWAGRTDDALALLLQTAAGALRDRAFDAAHCALTDLFFIGLDRWRLADLQRLQADIRECIQAHGDATWECRIGLLEAMLDWRRGLARAALGRARRAGDNVLAATTTRYMFSAYRKWEALSALVLREEEVVLELAERSRADRPPAGIEAIRCDFLGTLAARVRLVRGESPDELVPLAEQALVAIDALGGAWDERHPLIQALIIAGELDAAERWERRVGGQPCYPARLVRLDLAVARWLHARGEASPDWDLMPDCARRSGDPEDGSGETDPAPDELPAPLEEPFGEALQAARAEDVRLECSVHRREVGQRIRAVRRSREKERQP